MKKALAIVSGKVQGVGFRMSTRSQAKLLGVCGTVRNLSNGNVEIIAAGEAANRPGIRDRNPGLLRGKLGTGFGKSSGTRQKIYSGSNCISHVC